MTPAQAHIWLAVPCTTSTMTFLTVRSLLLASALLLAASLVHAGEFDHKNVAQYTAKNFKDKVVPYHHSLC